MRSSVSRGRELTSPNLRFSHQKSSSTALVFGINDLAQAEYFDLSLVASISVSAEGRFNADYDNAVSRGPNLWMETAWEKTQSATDTIKVAENSGRRLAHSIDAISHTAQRLSAAMEEPWQSLKGGDSHESTITLRQAFGASSILTDEVRELSRRARPVIDSSHRIADRFSAVSGDHWITLSMEVRPVGKFVWVEGTARALDQYLGFSAGTAEDIYSAIRWQESRLPAHGISDHSVPPVIPPDLYKPDTALRFSDRATASLALLFGKKSWTGPESRIVVPVRKIYMTINTRSVVIAETGQEIEARNIRLSIDTDSWTWLWSADVPAHYEQTLAAPIGSIVELIITLNGTAIRCAIQGRHRNRSFAKGGFKISGRGRAAWLADPLATEVYRTNYTAKTAQQLMAAALSDNGVALGWDIDWRLTDWIVPAGAWSHSGTAIEACIAIAGAAGGYIQAHSTDQLLHVLPRYPAAPWDWSGLTPDIDLPEDVCTVEDIDEQDKPLYNTVMVGGQANGVRCHVTRGGSDGGRPAPMVVDSLITHSDAGRQRGLTILSDTGRIKTIELSLPLLPETGIILPGRMIRYRESGNVHIGITRGVSVSGDFPKIRQGVRVETHVL